MLVVSPPLSSHALAFVRSSSRFLSHLSFSSSFSPSPDIRKYAFHLKLNLDLNSRIENLPNIYLPFIRVLDRCSMTRDQSLRVILLPNTKYANDLKYIHKRPDASASVTGGDSCLYRAGFSYGPITFCGEASRLSIALLHSLPSLKSKLLDEASSLSRCLRRCAS
jgi:hypothetical protein